MIVYIRHWRFDNQVTDYSKSLREDETADTHLTIYPNCLLYSEDHKIYRTNIIDISIVKNILNKYAGQLPLPAARKITISV